MPLAADCVSSGGEQRYHLEDVGTVNSLRSECVRGACDLAAPTSLTCLLADIIQNVPASSPASSVSSPLPCLISSSTICAKLIGDLLQPSTYIEDIIAFHFLVFHGSCN